MSYLFVALGGGLGAMLRFFVEPACALSIWHHERQCNRFLSNGDRLYSDTGKVGSKEVMFLMTGLLGGFTTFSAFSLDALKLWEAGKVDLLLVMLC